MDFQFAEETISVASSQEASSCGTPSKASKDNHNMLNEAGSAKKEPQGNGVCGVIRCDKPKMRFNVQFCGCHTRAYDNILKKNFPKKGGSPSKIPLENMSPEQQAFCTIFGRGREPWQPELGSQVLEDYVEQFPEAASISGKARGSVILTKFVNLEGSRNSTGTVSRGPMWDEELFHTRIVQFRPWDAKERKKQWTIIATTKDVETDSVNGRIRYRIPSWMLGEDWAEDRFENFQTRQMQTSHGKFQNMKQEDLSRAVRDCSQGFGHLQRTSQEEARLPVELSSATANPELHMDSSAILLKHASKIEASVDASNQIESQQPQAISANEIETAKKKAKIHDLGVQRTSAATDESSKNKKVTDALWSAMMKARAELERVENLVDPSVDRTSESGLLLERLEAGCLFFGLTIPEKSGRKDFSMPAGDASFGNTVDWDSRFTEFKNQNPDTSVESSSKLHTYMLQQELGKLQFLPVEHPEKFMSVQALRQLPDSMRTCSTSQALEELCQKAEIQRSLVEQLKEGVANAQRALKKMNDKASTSAKKEKQEQEKKRKADANSEMELRANALRKHVSKVRSQGPFNINWDELGSAIAVVENDAAYAALFADGSKKITEPLILKGSELLKTALGTKKGDSSKTIMQWLAVFEKDSPNQPYFKNNDRIQAPVDGKYDPEHLMPFFNSMLPNSCVLSERALFPITACAKPWFFAYATNMLHYDFEPESFATLRVHTAGMVKVLLVRGADIAKLLRLLPPSESLTTTPERVKDILSKLDEKGATKVQGEVTLYYALIDCSAGPVTLITPAGYYTCVSAASQNPVVGIRKSFLPKGCKDDYTAVPEGKTNSYSSIVEILEREG